jgi:putative oxidoreductase
MWCRRRLLGWAGRSINWVITVPRMADLSIAERPARNRAVHIALWILQVLLALAFVVPVYRKFAGLSDSVELFRRIGLGQWLRYAVGLLELTLAAGLLIPRVAGLAALGLVGVMIGATFSEIFVYGGKWPLPLGLALAAALVAGGRREQIRDVFLGLRDWLRPGWSTRSQR